MRLIIPIIMLLPKVPITDALVDCLHGFIGRMQAFGNDQYFHLNDTAMCSAMFCIKVIIHNAVDDDHIFQQGISSRCAYTGGDRHVCTKAKGVCQSIDFYEGMKGNFSFCCCNSNNCNSVTTTELNSIYNTSTESSLLASTGSSFNLLIAFFVVLYKIY